MKNYKYLIGLVLVLSLMVGVASVNYAGSATVITKEELLNVLDNPEVIVLDVRTGRDWKSSEFKIKGAVRANPQVLNDWISQHSMEKRFITYCA